MKRTTRIVGAATVALGLTLTSVGTAAVSTAAPRPATAHRALTPTQEQCLTDALTGLLAARADARAVRRAARADARAAYRSSLAKAAAATNRGERVAALRAYETTADSLRRTLRQARRAADQALNAAYREARAAYRQDRKVCLDPPPTS